MDVKKIVGISVGIVAVVVITAIIVKVVKNRRNPEDTAQGFNGLVERTKKTQPSVFTWWEALPVNSQIEIENSMTPEVLRYFATEFEKNKLSDEVKQKLASYGYRG